MSNIQCFLLLVGVNSRSFFSESNCSTSVTVDCIEQDIQVDIEPFTCPGWGNYSILYSLVLEGNEIRNYLSSNLNVTFTDVVPGSYVVEVTITNRCGQIILLAETITVPGMCQGTIPNT